MDRQSESPKERINITYKPKTDGLSEEIEIPYKIMVLGEFNPDEEEKAVEDKKVININKGNFNDVLEKRNVKINFSVKNQLVDDSDGELNINLNIKSIKDFSPEQLIDKVDELKDLMKIRESLIALKSPIGNVPAFKKAIESVIKDDEKRKKILEELSV